MTFNRPADTFARLLDQDQLRGASLKRLRRYRLLSSRLATLHLLANALTCKRATRLIESPTPTRDHDVQNADDSSVFFYCCWCFFIFYCCDARMYYIRAWNFIRGYLVTSLFIRLLLPLGVEGMKGERCNKWTSALRLRTRALSPSTPPPGQEIADIGTHLLPESSAKLISFACLIKDLGFVLLWLMFLIRYI